VIAVSSQLRASALAFLLLVIFVRSAQSQTPAEICSRAPSGSAITSPKNLASLNGTLEVNLSLRNYSPPDGRMRYCYIASNGSQSPTLRVSPGDLLVLKLKNDLSLPAAPVMAHAHSSSDDCGSGVMSPASTNLHFHGLAVPPVCHQDETVRTLIQPSDSAFEYRLRIPAGTPPGLYWYHPHPHGFSEEQVLGGASGALIVEGIERANRAAAGLPERVFIIRDEKLQNPRPANAAPDPNQPGKDLSINFIPVPYPTYPLAIIPMKPSQREFWRVLNASADTYLDLKLLFNGKPQFLGVIALDGAPIGYSDGAPRDHILWESHLALPPAGRAEFIVNGPPSGVDARLITQAVETGPVYDADSLRPPNSATAAPAASATGANTSDDDNTPARPLARVEVFPDAVEPAPLPSVSLPLGSSEMPPLMSVQPVRERKFYFSEKLQNPADPNSATTFYITEEGKTPEAYDPSSIAPNITVHQGEVEDWLIENRSQETHAFHIHQTHFIVLQRHGVPVDEPYLRDTINVPYWDGFAPQYPSIKLRLDFRDPAIVGTFPYHCHILQHEDGGMMGTIEVLRAVQASRTRRFAPAANPASGKLSP